MLRTITQSAIVLTLAAPVAAPTYSTPIKGATCGINNIAWVLPAKLMRSGAVIVNNDHLAGEQPTDGPTVEASYRQLKTTYHVGAVINLRLEANEDESAARSLGLKYLRLPIADGMPPTPEQVRQFFTFVKEQRDHHAVVLWHCAGGIGRTGVLTAMLRLKSGWSTQNAANEMFQMGLNYAQAAEHLPALNNFATALGQAPYYPPGWSGPRQSRYDYRNIAPRLPVLQ